MSMARDNPEIRAGVCRQPHRTWIWAVLGLALAIRVAYSLFEGFNTPPDRRACGADTVELEYMAWSAAQGQGFRITPDSGLSAFRAPGYPMLLSLLYMVLGRAYWANRLFLVLLSTGTCALTYVLARRLGLSEVAAILATAITAVLPLQFYFSAHFMSEVPAAFFVVLSTLLLTLALQASRSAGQATATGGKAHMRAWLLWLAAGFVAGFGALIRPAGVLLGPAVAFLLVFFSGLRLRVTLLAVALFAAGMMAPIAPWTYRNWIVFERFCLVGTNGGSTFWGANNAIVADPSSGKWGYWISTNFDMKTKARRVLTLENEVDRDKQEWREGLQFLRQNLARIPILTVGKFYRLITPFPQSANRMFVLIVAIGQVFLLPISLVGLWLMLRGARQTLMLPVWAQLLTLLGTTVVFYGSERFRAPYETLLALFSSVTLVRCAAMWRYLAPRRGNTISLQKA
jgi:4-amino-4-deoxy-L-arabinose transferase-like glycosyltransferase